jgi:hypothetical protein
MLPRLLPGASPVYVFGIYRGRVGCPERLRFMFLAFTGAAFAVRSFSGLCFWYLQGPQKPSRHAVSANSDTYDVIDGFLLILYVLHLHGFLHVRANEFVCPCLVLDVI